MQRLITRIRQHALLALALSHDVKTQRQQRYYSENDATVR